MVSASSPAAPPVAASPSPGQGVADATAGAGAITAFQLLLAGGGFAPAAAPLPGGELSTEDGKPAPTDTTAESGPDAAPPGNVALLWMQWLRPAPAANHTAAAPTDIDDPLAETDADIRPAIPAARSLPAVLSAAALPKAEPLPADAAATAPPAIEASLPEDLPALPAMATGGQDAQPVDATNLAVATPDQPLGNAFSNLLPTVPAAAPVVAPPALPVVNTLQPDWTQTLGEQISWSLDEQQDAVIELHPAELGSLSVRVETRGNEAQVTIVAATPAARDLLQQSLPQLRELLSAQGLNLARAQVERPAGSSFGNQAQSDGGARERRDATTRGRRALAGLLLVDSYA